MAYTLRGRIPCVAVVDLAVPCGYQLKSKAGLLASGALYDKVAADIKAKMPQLRSPRRLVKINDRCLFPVPEAGKK